MWARRRRQARIAAAGDRRCRSRPTASGPPGSARTGAGIHPLADVGADDAGIGRLPGVGACDIGPRTGLNILLTHFGRAWAVPEIARALAVGALAIGIASPLLMDRLSKPEWKATGDTSAP